MTPLEHNRYVGIANHAYGAIHVLLMIVMAGLFMAMMGVEARDTGKGAVPPTNFLGAIMAFAVGINLILAIPSFIAGYALLKRKRWAKIAGIIAAVLSAIRIPFGTVVSIYTFWFLFSEPGRLLYENGSQALPPQPPSNWANLDQKEGSVARDVRPTSLPDWR